MKRISSSLHFAWDGLDECFTRTSDELQLDGVELSFDARHERLGCTHNDIANMRKVNEDRGLSLAAHIWEDVAQLGPGKGARRCCGSLPRSWHTFISRTTAASTTITCRIDPAQWTGMRCWAHFAESALTGSSAWSSPSATTWGHLPGVWPTCRRDKAQLPTGCPQVVHKILPYPQILALDRGIRYMLGY